ncbi:hypothetical protein N9137_00970 [Pseudomonadales bacterium]|nr:hypothetical protein [Pseudomonadales bacterium]
MNNSANEYSNDCAKTKIAYTLGFEHAIKVATRKERESQGCYDNKSDVLIVAIVMTICKIEHYTWQVSRWSQLGNEYKRQIERTNLFADDLNTRLKLYQDELRPHLNENGDYPITGYQLDKYYLKNIGIDKESIEARSFVIVECGNGDRFVRFKELSQ